MTRLADLVAHLEADDAARIAPLVDTLIDLGLSPDLAAGAWLVPGRIEVLGKHTDYAGGRSLVTATEQGFALVATAREDNRLRVIDVERREIEELELRPDLELPWEHWSVYPATVARRLAANFPGDLWGADIALASNLPSAAGLSSSSAFVVAVYLALAKVNGLEERIEYRREIDTPEKLAGYLGAVENGLSFGGLKGEAGVGTLGGSEDHTAILCSRPAELGQYRYLPVRQERRIPLPNDLCFAVAASGIEAEKTGAAQNRYNRLSGLTIDITSIWRRAKGTRARHLAAALAEAAGSPDAIRAALTAAAETTLSATELLRRFEHFLEENEEIVLGGGDSLAAGDLRTFGELVDRSQRLAEELLGNQVPETVFLQRSARELGAVAASAFGAGFGGAVWALVEKEAIDRFVIAWSGRYLERFAEHQEKARFFTTTAGPGAHEIEPLA
ncbi:MAG: galactokinase family protein [Thermoanaerobaculia bacterium]